MSVAVSFKDAFDALDRLRYESSEYDVDLVRRYIVDITSDAIDRIQTSSAGRTAAPNVGPK